MEKHDCWKMFKTSLKRLAKDVEKFRSNFSNINFNSFSVVFQPIINRKLLYL